MPPASPPSVSGQTALELLRTAMDAIVACDSLGRMVLFNEAAERLFRCAASDMLGQPIDALIPERVRSKHGAWMTAFGETHSANRRMRSPGLIYARRWDGTECPIDASISCLDDGGERLYVAILRDVSERVANEEWKRLAERSIAELKTRLQMAIRDSGFGVWEYDFREQRVMWDDAMHRLYGLDPAQFDGTLRQWRALIHDDDLPIFDSRFTDLSLDALSSTVIFRAIRSDDHREVFIESNGYIALDSPGLPRRLMGMSRDVTAQVNTETQLRKLNSELSERVHDKTIELRDALEEARLASEMKTVFLSAVSHELRTPMHSILGFASLLQDHTSTEGPASSYLGKILKHGNALLSLIDDLLDSAKIRSATFSLSPARIDLRLIMESVAAEFLPQVMKNDVHLAIETPGHGAYVGDAARLAQAFRNVLANAIRFSPAGGTVRMALSDTPSAYVLAISDQGRGIPESERERIFENFAQSSLTGTKDGGTGLGLSIARGIIEAHGGSITAEQNEPRGACFVIVLPHDRAAS